LGLKNVINIDQPWEPILGSLLQRILPLENGIATGLTILDNIVLILFSLLIMIFTVNNVEDDDFKGIIDIIPKIGEKGSDER
jgi:hypothetical protein